MKEKRERRIKYRYNPTTDELLTRCRFRKRDYVCVGSVGCRECKYYLYGHNDGNPYDLCVVCNHP